MTYATAKTAFEDGFFTQRLSMAAANRRLVADVVAWYIDVFNARGSGEWGEAWTPETAERKLFSGLADVADHSLLTTWRVAGRVVGASIVSVGLTEDVLTVRDLPPGRQDGRTLEAVMKNVFWVAGRRQLIAQFREIGIVREFRSGWQPVVRLMMDPGVMTIETWGTSYQLFWTSKRARLYPIMAGVESRVIYDFGDAAGNVLMGDDIKDTRRRLSEDESTVRAMIAERLEQTGALSHYRGRGTWKLVRAAERLEKALGRIKNSVGGLVGRFVSRKNRKEGPS
jgi:hypothetical protein